MVMYGLEILFRFYAKSIVNLANYNKLYAYDVLLQMIGHGIAIWGAVVIFGRDKSRGEYFFL